MIAMTVTTFAAGIVVYACFCRLTKTTRATFTTVRFTIWALAACSMLAIVAPLLWGWRPDLMHAAILAAVAMYQVATRRTWQHGVPEWFTRVAPQ